MPLHGAILVAEVDPNDVLLFERALSHAGATGPIIFVRDGQEVIDYLSGESPLEDWDHLLPALIILDVVMPRVSGFEVLDWIRRDGRFSHIPVLAFSDLNSPTAIGRAFSLGAKFFLLKTAGITQWTNVLRSVCEIYDLAQRSEAGTLHPETSYLAASQLL